MKSHFLFDGGLKLSKAIHVFFFTCSCYTSFAQVSATELLKGKPANSQTVQWLCDSALSVQRDKPDLAGEMTQLALRKAIEWRLNPEVIEKAKAALIVVNQATIDSTRFNIIIDINTAKAKIELSAYSEAQRLLDKALTSSKRSGLKQLEKQVCETSGVLYRKLQNYESALESYKSMVAADKELQDIQLEEAISSLNEKYETEKRKKMIAELEKESLIERTLKNTIVVVVSTITIILITILLSQYQKKRKEQQISQLKLQQLSRQIISKSNEITTYTLSFLQKNQLMEELKEQINELKKSSNTDKYKELTRINRIVDNTFRSDEEWKKFQITFDQMHDGFFSDLKKDFPNISNAELKLCALLRLNMNLKESAKILGIAPDSVKTSRYRLRKKLGLKTEDNLVEFLLGFEKPGGEESA